MRTRTLYIPISEAEVDMVLGAPLNVVHRGRLNLSLPTDHVLTAENLQQLSAHFAEFMCVVQPDTRSDDDFAAEYAVAVARVTQIFEGADMNDPTLAALFAQVLRFRTS